MIPGRARKEGKKKVWSPAGSTPDLLNISGSAGKSGFLNRYGALGADFNAGHAADAFVPVHRN